MKDQRPRGTSVSTQKHYEPSGQPAPPPRCLLGNCSPNSSPSRPPEAVVSTYITTTCRPGSEDLAARAAAEQVGAAAPEIGRPRRLLNKWRNSISLSPSCL